MIQEVDLSDTSDEKERGDSPNFARNLYDIVAKRDALIILLLCFICGLVGDPTLNVYSLWMYTPRDDGGMGYTPFEYAQFKFYGALIVISMELYLPVLLLQIWGKRKCLSISYLVLVLMTGISWLPSRLSSGKLSFAFSLTIFVICRIPISVIKVTDTILLKNIFPKDTHGRVLGVATGFAVGGRLIGYMITGVCFAWSLSNLKKTSGYINFPLDEAFTFILLSVFALCGVVAGRSLTDSVELSQSD